MQRQVSWLAGRGLICRLPGSCDPVASGRGSPLTVAGAADDWALCMSPPSRHSQFIPSRLCLLAGTFAHSGMKMRAGVVKDEFDCDCQLDY